MEEFRNFILLLLAVMAGCSPVNTIDSIPSNRTETPIVSNFQTFVNTSTPAPVLMSSHISGWVVYSLWVSQDPVESQIFLKDLKTGEVMQLTHSGNNSRPLWSPDGSQIMFLSWTKENSFDIYLMDRDGKNQRPVIVSPSMDMMADWSPDGNKIVFASDRDGHLNIYVIDLNTQSLKRLTNSPVITGSPRWSHDGKYIAFISNTGTSGTTQVFTMNADGTNVRPVTDYDLYYDDNPVWCPDSSCIIFTRSENGSKLMFLELASKAVKPLLTGLFDHSERISEFGLGQSSSRGYITFYVDEIFYAMDVKSWEIYPLQVEAKDLSLYP